MKLLRLTKVNSAGGEFPVYVSRLYIEYVERCPSDDLTVVRTNSAWLYVKESLSDILRMLGDGDAAE